ncbi:MAG: porin family protein [Cryomorphaceae bacterium]
MKTQSYLKVFSILFLTWITAHASFAQVSLGGRAGINVGSFRWDEATRNSKDIGTSSQIGPHVSFVALYEPSSWFGLQAEIQYIQKGAKASFGCENCQVQNGTDANGQPQVVTATELDQELLYKTNYIEVPILARIRLGGDNFAFNGFLGPTFGMALSGTSRFSQDLEVQNQQPQNSVNTEKLDFDKDYNRFDIGGLVGAGFQVAAGPGSITFDLRYVLGISNLVKEDDPDERVKNRSFQIGVGYIVPL